MKLRNNPVHNTFVSLEMKVMIQLMDNDKIFCNLGCCLFLKDPFIFFFTPHPFRGMCKMHPKGIKKLRVYPPPEKRLARHWLFS